MLLMTESTLLTSARPYMLYVAAVCSRRHPDGRVACVKVACLTWLPGVTRTAISRSDWCAWRALYVSYVSCISRPCALRVHAVDHAPPCGGRKVDLEALFDAARSPVIRCITPRRQVIMPRPVLAGCCCCAGCLHQAQTVNLRPFALYVCAGTRLPASGGYSPDQVQLIS